MPPHVPTAAATQTITANPVISLASVGLGEAPASRAEELGQVVSTTPVSASADAARIRTVATHVLAPAAAPGRTDAGPVRLNATTQRFGAQHASSAESTAAVVARRDVPSATTFSGDVYVETQVIEVDATILDRLPLGRGSVLFIETGRDEIRIPTSSSAKRAQCERDES